MSASMRQHSPNMGSAVKLYVHTAGRARPFNSNLCVVAGSYPALKVAMCCPRTTQAVQVSCLECPPVYCQHQAWNVPCAAPKQKPTQASSLQRPPVCSSRRSRQVKMAAMHCTAGSSGATPSWAGEHSVQQSNRCATSSCWADLQAATSEGFVFCVGWRQWHCSPANSSAQVSQGIPVYCSPTSRS